MKTSIVLAMAAVNRNRRRIGLFLVIGCVFTTFLWSSREPLVAGKSLHEWKKELLHDGHLSYRDDDTLRNLGANAVPILISGLRTRETPLNWIVSRIEPYLPASIQQELPKTFDPASVRRISAAALGKLGAPATNSVPELVDLVHHDSELELMFACALALSDIGNAAPKSLLPVLPGIVQSFTEKTNAVWAAVLVTVASNLESDSANQLRGEFAPAIPGLIQLLDEPHLNAQCVAARVLGFIGPSAKEAIVKLRQNLGDTSILARVTAARALWQIEGAGPELIAVLLNTVGAPEGSANVMAMETLGQIGPAAAAAIPKLEIALASRHKGLRLTAATALWRVAGSTNAISALTELVVDSTRDAEYWRVRAVRALADIGSPARSAIPSITRVLQTGPLKNTTGDPAMTEVFMREQVLFNKEATWALERIRD